MIWQQIAAVCFAAFLTVLFIWLQACQNLSQVFYRTKRRKKWARACAHIQTNEWTKKRHSTTSHNNVAGSDSRIALALSQADCQASGIKHWLKLWNLPGIAVGMPVSYEHGRCSCRRCCCCCCLGCWCYCIAYLCSKSRHIYLYVYSLELTKNAVSLVGTCSSQQRDSCLELCEVFGCVVQSCRPSLPYIVCFCL